MTTAPASTTDTIGDAVVRTLVELKPRLRGWLHAYAAAASIGTGSALLVAAFVFRGPHAGWPITVYGLTVTALFGTSALYHRRHWSPRGHAIMKRLDHSMIFVFIAGTYTPIAVLTLPHGSAIAVLTVVWTGALCGVALKTAWPGSPSWVSVPCYVGLGWVAIFVFPDLLQRGGVVAFVLIAAGGVIYTLGAVIYALKRPDPAPGVFGFHEVFHACTLLAALCHYVAIWFAVLA